MRPARFALAGALGATLLGLAACASDPTRGYALTSSYDQSIETVSVPMFDNYTFEHGLETILTDAIIKEIHRSTPWRVVERERAQATLSGAITSADLRSFSRNTDSGLVQEMALDVGVAFEFRSNADERVLVSRRNFHAAEAFVPAYPAQERLELSRRTTADQLARDIVAELRSSW